MISKKLQGTGVALITPFDKQQGIDAAALERLVQHLTQGGVDYLVALGTTAEPPTLSQSEKSEILAQIKRYNTARLPLVVGIGGNSTADVTAQIGQTDFDGVDALLSITPYYNKPPQQGLYEHYKAIAAASPVPVILYNVPSRTGVNLLPETVLRLAKEVPNIAAIKEASGNVAQVAAILRGKPADFAVISGDDGLTVPLISLGAQGLISVVGNAFPAATSAMVKAALQGDFATAAQWQLTLLPITEACFAEGNPVGVKAALSVLGLVQNYLRLPLVPASPALIERIKQCVQALKERTAL
ncbi:4-hydroxy-tetrahydrodipicolinate synthase [Bacteroidia bacterium]|nr:4-hydroxy-tetrahydrodipicolinate synthase [Bacteroidia bacterium]